MSGGRSRHDECGPGDPVEMVTWLENKWVRHGELEDLAAARLIEFQQDNQRALAAQVTRLEIECSLLHSRLKA